MKLQQPIAYQLDMFTEQAQKAIDHSDNREDVHRTKAGRVRQVQGAGKQGRALAGRLMPIVCSFENIREAYKQVKRNKRATGIDQMPTGQFAQWLG